MKRNTHTHSNNGHCENQVCVCIKNHRFVCKGKTLLVSRESFTPTFNVVLLTMAKQPESSYVPTSGWMDRENVAHMLRGMLPRYEALPYVPYHGQKGIVLGESSHACKSNMAWSYLQMELKIVESKEVECGIVVTRGSRGQREGRAEKSIVNRQSASYTRRKRWYFAQSNQKRKKREHT